MSPRMHWGTSTEAATMIQTEQRLFGRVELVLLQFDFFFLTAGNRLSISGCQSGFYHSEFVYLFEWRRLACFYSSNAMTLVGGRLGYWGLGYLVSSHDVHQVIWGQILTNYLTSLLGGWKTGAGMREKRKDQASCLELCGKVGYPCE